MKLIFGYFKRAICEFPKHFLVAMGLILIITGLNTFVPVGLRQFLEEVEKSNIYKVINSCL